MITKIPDKLKLMITIKNNQTDINLEIMINFPTIMIPANVKTGVETW